jgi:hypothetical protein
MLLNKNVKFPPAGVDINHKKTAVALHIYTQHDHSVRHILMARLQVRTPRIYIWSVLTRRHCATAAGTLQ